jgi:hypothetical protein
MNARADLRSALSEAQIQSQIRSYLSALGIDSVHFANGAVLAGDKIARAKQINKLKRAGMVPGASDLILFDRRVRRVGFLEVKKPGSYQSPGQKDFEQLAVGVWGWPYAVVRSQEDTQAVLHEWGWR